MGHNSFPLGRNCQRTWLWHELGRKGGGHLFEGKQHLGETLQSVIQQTIPPWDFQRSGHYSKDEFSPWLWEAQEALAPVILYFLLSLFMKWMIVFKVWQPCWQKNVSCFYMWSELKPPGVYPNKREICGSLCNLLSLSVHVIPGNFQDGAQTSSVLVVPIPAFALCNVLLFILIYSTFKSRLTFSEHFV